MNTLLEIDQLQVQYRSARSSEPAVKNASLSIQKGETYGLIGESGSGKSTLALSIPGLLPHAEVKGKITLHFQGESTDLTSLKNSQLKDYRGSKIAMIFQEPMSSLNPVIRCGNQLEEAIRTHDKSLPKKDLRKAALSLLSDVKIREPERVFRAFPHQLSGGQKQRIMIAIAMAGEPDLLIADEPTTALDTITQLEILNLLQTIQKERNLSLLFITHDIGVASKICGKLGVMRKGELLEEGETRAVIEHPKNEYTKGLIACRPSIDRQLHRLPTLSNPEIQAAKTNESSNESSIVVEGRGITLEYLKPGGIFQRSGERVQALKGIDFQLYRNECFGIVGESGSGKSSLGKVLCGLEKTQAGTLRYQTDPKRIQMVFQDPYSSLDPLQPIGKAIIEPMQGLDNQSRRAKAEELLRLVGLDPEQHFNRLPQAFSGGQRQRIAIARALAGEPELLICDEITSALDVSVQATVLNLLKDIQEQMGLTIVFISHDLAVIRQMCNRIMVLSEGKVDCGGWPEELYKNPPTAYLQALLNAHL